MKNRVWPLFMLIISLFALFSLSSCKEEIALLDVAYTAQSGGAIVGETTQSVASGTDATAVTAIPAEGYRFTMWSDGYTEATRTDLAVQTSFTVQAQFERISLTVTYKAQTGGTLTGTATQALDYGTDATAITATPNTGYLFLGWSDGVKTATRTDLAVCENLDVTALFAKSVHSATYEAQTGGYLTGDTVQSVAYGENATTVIANPLPGYLFIKWSDGITTPARTDLAVKADVSVTAQFSKSILDISYAAQTGGSIEGTATQTIPYGSSASTVTAVAAQGYEFISWSDGLNTPSRTDSDVQEALTLTALFRRITWKVSFTCVGNQGSIQGTATQTVPSGDACTSVTAVANLGYKFLCWSDGTITEEITYTPTEDTELYAIFAVDAMELPIITINTEGYAPILNKEDYVNCTVSVSNTDYEYALSGEGARIKLRGNSTSTLDKKPYKLKFDSKIDLFGNGKAKEWCLIANYSDYSQIRNYLAYTLGAQMTDLDYTTTVQFVELYLNGQYDGVYLVCEQTEVGSTRVDIDESYDTTDTGYLIELDARAPDEGTLNREYFEVDGRYYAVKSPDVEEDAYTLAHTAFIKTYFEACMAALESNDYAAVCELIDVNTFADFYIVHELFNCVDVGYSSFYMYKLPGGKLYAGPLWDFDLSAGNDDKDDNELSMEYNRLWAKEDNVWYAKLLNYHEFQALVAEKLASYEEIITETIEQAVLYVTSCRNAFERNFERWDILGKYVWPNPTHLVAITTWDEHLEQVTTFLENSLAYMKTQYPAPTEP